VGLRLHIVSWWMPKYLTRRELAKLSNETTNALQAILTQYAPQESIANVKQQTCTNIDQQRINMAQTHAELVEKLVVVLGYEKAVALGREALFLVGENLGKQIRRSLGVSDSPKDLIRAAKILYHILGIEFHLEWLDSSNVKAVIDQCPLAEYYSKLTCEVLSATDEGVIKGLQPRAVMKFKEYMTNGCKNCRADIHFKDKEALK